MAKTCQHSQTSFEVTPEEKAFLDQISPSFNGVKYQIPEPNISPSYRQRLRLQWRNETNLYKRTCDGTGESILSVYSKDKPYTIYKAEYWYSDKWDGLSFGRDFDFNRPFFEQFNELIHAVPQLALSVVNNQNCDFVNQCGWCKDCYLIFEADGNEGCYYCSNTYDSKTCIDCSYISNCQICYQCLDCRDCYNLKYSRDCQNCSDSYFLKNCIGCKNCFGCVNLKNKEYYFYNQQLTKEQYEQKIAEYNLGSNTTVEYLKTHFKEYCLSFPNKNYHGNNNENSDGDYLYNTQNCHSCFDITNSQNCQNVFNSRNARNSHDVTTFGAESGMDFCYECHEVGGATRNVIFSDQIWTNCYDIAYSKLCTLNCHHLFGCVGLKHKSFCVFNKQYSEEEYNQLVPRIIQHMQQTGEWGQFFPAHISPFAYNETEAQVHFPITEEQAQQHNIRWHQKDMSEYKPSMAKIPDDIAEASEDITTQVFSCEETGKNYKIIPQELKFYKQNKIPAPKKCFHSRHQDRINQRNPRILYDRNCAKTGQAIKTTYSPHSPDIVYNEQSFQDSMA